MKVRSVLQGPGFSYQQQEEENSETRPAMPASAFLESKARFLLVISFLKGAWCGFLFKQEPWFSFKTTSILPLCTDRGNCFVHEESPASFLAFPVEELRLHRLPVTIAVGPEEQRDLKLLLSCLCSAPVSTVLVRLVHTWLIVISKANVVTLRPDTAPSIWRLRFTRWNCLATAACAFQGVQVGNRGCLCGEKS